MGQLNVNFHTRKAIKGQALADFIAEFTYSTATEVTGTTDGAEAAKAAEVKGRKDSVPIEEDVE